MVKIKFIGCSTVSVCATCMTNPTISSAGRSISMLDIEINFDPNIEWAIRLRVSCTDTYVYCFGDGEFYADTQRTYLECDKVYWVNVIKDRLERVANGTS